jgi:hypothetical protein
VDRFGTRLAWEPTASRPTRQPPGVVDAAGGLVLRYCLGGSRPDVMEARQVTLQSRSPQRPDDLVAEFEEAGPEQVAAAAGRARAAGEAWAAA